MPKEIVWTEELLARFWGYHAQFPEVYFSLMAGRSVVRQVARHIPKGARVLDFGCGPGFLLGHMLDQGWHAAGCEISHAAIGNHARALSNRPNFGGLNTTSELLAKGQRFDAIFLCEVIEHLDDRPLGDVIEAVRTLLEPGGKLIVTTPNDEDLSANMIYCPVADITFHRWQHVRSWSAASLSKFLSTHGLTPVEVRTLRFRDRQEPALQYALHRALRMVRPRKAPNLLAVVQRQ